MEDYKISNYELHLKSILGELILFDAEFDESTILSVIMDYLEEKITIPGVIIKHNGKFAGFVTKKSIYQRISKPYGIELYLRREINFFFESYKSAIPLILPSSMLIIEAVKIALERKKENFDDPIIIEFDNGKFKILDSYHLLLAHSYINTIALNALKEANEFKVELLSMAAHDLKNPLNTIMGYSKLLEEFIEDKGSDLFDMVHSIHLTSENMFAHVVELLNSTVIESGKIQLKKQILDLGELVTAIVYQNRLLAEKKSQILDFNPNYEEYYNIFADSLKIRESIENLISNAIKYSSFNSIIYIEVKTKDGMVVFSVKDNGPGLSDDDKSKLFGKFQRLSAQPTAGESSTGLGLFIAKQIIELHNGKIYVESELGAGSTFFIELPLTEDC